ncbi:MAG: hypothetical protein C4527_27380 [Candidatus Omnitrophota bacterium]|jgi:predicted nucleotidyltransferase|nr:MAG: hypothetical protein C4527_27380 [Candidatus Omnitrophota bacterium]
MSATPIMLEYMKDRLREGFEEQQAVLLADVVYFAHQELVKTGDFNELKAIVKDLAEAQKRTETKVEELVELQKQTEITVKELVEAHKETQREIKKLTEEVRELAISQNSTQIELGGLSRSMGYALENEAYRMIPHYLNEKFGIVVEEKLIRTEIGHKEINLFGRARKDGKELFIIGEAKLRLDERRHKFRESIFDELEEKVNAVQAEYGKKECIRILITHFARKSVLDEAREKGVIIIQSFDW